MSAKNTIDLILLRVHKTESCWLWLGPLVNGYGKTDFLGRKVYVHRLLYEHLIGPIAKGLELDHLCRIRKCCSPAHLEPVTSKENNNRGLGNGNKEKTSCKQGHDFSEDNTYIAPSGKRCCRVCQRAAVDKYQAKK